MKGFGEIKNKNLTCPESDETTHEISTRCDPVIGWAAPAELVWNIFETTTLRRPLWNRYPFIVNSKSRLDVFKSKLSLLYYTRNLKN